MSVCVGGFSMSSVSLVIPTLDAQAEIGDLLNQLMLQTCCPDEIIVVDSSSSDHTVEIASGFAGVRVIEIDRSVFNHGLTRDMAVKESFGDIVCFMTQDAIPANNRYIENLIAPILSDECVAISSGRQLPKADARKFERLVRAFNYGPESNVRSKADLPKLGIKTYFATDVCSAYRRRIYNELGGFGRTDMSEDMLMAAKAVNAGYSVAYAADACVYHSHNLSPAEQYRRNYAIGYFLESNKEIVACTSEVGEGGRLVKQVGKRLLLDHSFFEFGAFGVDCFARLIGNRFGRMAAKKERH